MPDTVPMKILTIVSVAIVVVDLEVLRKTFVEYFSLKSALEEEPYQQCYKPQAQLRIVFQCYAIYAALVCTSLTSMLALKCTDLFVETVARLIINLSFLVFGPFLLTFVNYGFIHFKQLAFVCTPRGASHRVNFLDIVLIVACFVLALCVTFTMAMQKTLDMAQQGFQDESSLIYRLASMYFSQQVRQSQERDREQLRQRSEERREQRRLRQAEREQVLTAFQDRHPEIAMPLGSTCPQQPNAASSQASTVAMIVPQRTFDAGLARANRDLANMHMPEDAAAPSAPMHTMHSSEQNDQQHYLLEEDFDEEMQGNFLVDPRRETNQEFAQTQEDSHLNKMALNMPEAQLLNSYKSLNQQFQSSEQSKAPQLKVAAQNQFGNTANQVSGGSIGKQDQAETAISDAELDGNHLFMKNEERKESEILPANGSKNEDEVVHPMISEQLIKDDKTVSGASISQASTQIQTSGSQVSSVGAVVVSSPRNATTEADTIQRPSVGAAVPASNQRVGPILEDSPAALDQRSDIAFQSIDGTSIAHSSSVRPNSQHQNEKKD